MKNDLSSLSIVVSVYNEEAGIVSFWEELYATLLNLKELDIEIVFVNDGSIDSSKLLIKQIVTNDRFSAIEFCSIEFSKNFGHEAAMIAGIDVSTKDVVVCMDADLQHPPEKILEMINSFKSGYEIVTMIREKRNDNGVGKNFASKLFYKLLNSISDYKFDQNASDYFMISKRVAGILKENFRERNRCLRAYIQTVGFPKTSLPFVAPSRKNGESSYTLIKLMKLSFNAMFSFSNKPLQVSLFISLIFAFFTASFMLFTLWVYFFGDTPPSGYTTIMIFMSTCFTILFLLIGILSLYFGKSLEEIRQRPIYLIKDLKKSNSK